MGEHPIEQVLRPETMGLDKLDFRTSWLLWIYLKGRGANFPDSKPSKKSGRITITHSARADSLTMSLVFQLEHLGLWTWACYVALFLNIPNERERLIRLLIGKHFSLADVSSSCQISILRASNGGFNVGAGAVGFGQTLKHSENSEEFNFLVNKLMIPSDWIFEARVIIYSFSSVIFFY